MSNKQLQLRRGTSSEHTAFTGAEGELTYVTDSKTLRVHDGTTAGGIDVGGTALVTSVAGRTGDVVIASSDVSGLADVATSGSYNDLTDAPTIPTVPSVVSAFTNDAGYITAASLPSVPTNVSAFTNDVGYITASSLPTNVSELTNDAGYITAASLPTVPSNVSAFTNDAGYITAASLPTVPSNVSAFTNDAGYITSSSLPTNVSELTNDSGYITAASLPTVPTNVSAFTNDAGYITSATLALDNLTDVTIGSPLQGDALVYNGTLNIWVASKYDYNDLINAPTIPTVPTSVSAFTNDAGYITASDLPTNVSELTNDAGYITSASLPTVPTNVSELTNDAGYVVTSALGTAAYEDVGTDAGNVVQLDGSAKLPAIDGSQLLNLPSGASNLNGLTDVTISSVASGQALVYNGSLWVNSQVAYTDLTGAPTLGTASALNVGITIGDVVQLVNVGGSAALPAVDGSQLTNLPSLAVEDLTNVSGIATASQLLQYNSLTSNWEPKTLAVSAFSNDAGYLTGIGGQSLENLQDVGYPVTSPADGEVLTFNATVGGWINQAPSGGGGLGSFTYQLIQSATTASFTAQVSYHYGVEASTKNVAATLPPATTAGERIRFKLRDNAFSLIISPNGTDTIDGVPLTSGSYTMSNPKQAVEMVSNGSGDWEVF